MHFPAPTPQSHATSLRLRGINKLAEEVDEDKVEEEVVGEAEEAMAARQSNVLDKPGTFSRTQLANKASETHRRASSNATTLPKL
jgi:hypothetical protein